MDNKNHNLHLTDVNYCAKTVPDSTKLLLLKGPNYFLRWACSQTPLVCCMLCMWIRTCLPPSPNNAYNLISTPLGQKAERNHASTHNVQLSHDYFVLTLRHVCSWRARKWGCSCTHKYIYIVREECTVLSSAHPPVLTVLWFFEVLRVTAHHGRSAELT